MIEILYENTVAAYWEGHTLHPCENARLPMALRRTGDLRTWLSMRMADTSRFNIRRLYDWYAIREDDSCAVLLPFHAAAVTDHYWIRQEGDAGTWEEIGALSDSMAEAALTGAVPTERTLRTPEMTNIGSFEKCWKRDRSGSWMLVKRASGRERFSELFAERLGRALGLRMAEYFPDSRGIASRDFTDGGMYALEHAAAFSEEEEPDEILLERLAQICPEAAGDYADMLYFDALIFNPDRHSANWGLLLRPDGSVLGLAPLFDHNAALIARGEDILDRRMEDRLIRDYRQLVRRHPVYARAYPDGLAEAAEEIGGALSGSAAQSRRIAAFLTARAKMLHALE